MEEHAPQNNILEMIEMLIKLELNMEAVFNSDLHFHLGNLFCFLYIAIVVQDCKIKLLYDRGLHVAGHCGTDEVAYTPGDAIECLVLLLEVWEFEFKVFALRQDACWLQLF